MFSANGSVVAIGGSAGGVESLIRVVAGLPPDLGAPVLAVIHVAPNAESRLPEILTRAGPLPAQHALDGEELQPNRIYVAPPDHHLLVRNHQSRVIRGAAENGHRPAIDALLRTAALDYRGGLVAVILSGMLDDGSAGARAVYQLGGAVIVQDPEDAAFPDMPASAIRSDHPWAVLGIAEIPAEVVRLVSSPPRARADDGSEDELRLEAAYAAMDRDALERPDVLGARSPFGCPACGGVLWEPPDSAEQLRFRCRIGHAYGADSLLGAQDDRLEASLAAGLRALHERADLARRIGQRLRGAGAGKRADRYDRL
ncbi:MAG TPA: chemotaxis protein CheB, partial [Gaiellaceae bacterium]